MWACVHVNKEAAHRDCFVPSIVVLGLGLMGTMKSELWALPEEVKPLSCQLHYAAASADSGLMCPLHSAC